MTGDMTALQLVLTGDPGLYAIVRLSLLISLSAVLLAALVGVPVGAVLALTRFRGREVPIVILNALMGLPPVVVGLAIFLLLSRSGPLGSWGILFTPQAMVIAQTVLVAPIIAALTRQTIDDLWVEYRDELAAMNVGPGRRIVTLIWDARFSLVTALLAGFGRAAAEVGAIIIVGGNIEGFTRTMTTAIALETSKGDLPLAVGLGLILIFIVILINAMAPPAPTPGRTPIPDAGPPTPPWVCRLPRPCCRRPRRAARPVPTLARQGRPGSVTVPFVAGAVVVGAVSVPGAGAQAPQASQPVPPVATAPPPQPQPQPLPRAGVPISVSGPSVKCWRRC